MGLDAYFVSILSRSLHSRRADTFPNPGGDTRYRPVRTHMHTYRFRRFAEAVHMHSQPVFPFGEWLKHALSFSGPLVAWLLPKVTQSVLDPPFVASCSSSILHEPTEVRQVPNSSIATETHRSTRKCLAGNFLLAFFCLPESQSRWTLSFSSLYFSASAVKRSRTNPTKARSPSTSSRSSRTIT